MEVTRVRRSVVWPVLLVAAALVVHVETAPTASKPLAHSPAGTTAAPLRLGPTPAGEQVSFDVALHLPHRVELTSFSNRVNEPGTTEYHHYLSAAEIGERFGAAPRDIARVVAWLRAHGLDRIETYPQRTTVQVRGSAGAIDRMLGITLVDFRDPVSHQRFRRTVGVSHLPRGIAPIIDGIVGLDTEPRARPRLVARRVDQPASVSCPACLTPNQSAHAFGIDALHDRGIRGDGQSVAIIMDGDVSDTDLKSWRTATGITDAPPIQRKTVGVGPDSAERRDPTAILEGSMDVEQVLGAAPHAHVLYYQTSLGGDEAPQFGDAVNQIVKDGKARIATFSAGECDIYGNAQPGGAAARASVTTALQTAAAAGVNVFVSSGDNGAYECSKWVPGDFRLTTSFPSDSPYAIAVGGTFLDRTSDGTYVSEAAWGQPVDNSGGGGGLNPFDARPEWQRGPGVQNSASNGKRQSPDVAGPGDPVSGWFVFQNGKAEPIAGTSASSPFWAGTAALFQQMAQKAGVGPLGFLDPTLYALAAANPPNTLFHDVVRGNNLYYNATPAWDYATGLGSPIASKLGDAIVAYLRAHRSH